MNNSFSRKHSDLDFCLFSPLPHINLGHLLFLPVTAVFVSVNVGPGTFALHESEVELRHTDVTDSKLPVVSSIFILDPYCDNI